MKLEVIATSIEDIKQINQSQADRIEFCFELERGGLTPNHQAIKEAGEVSKLPVNVMLRPNDFGYVYSDQDFTQMLDDAKFIATTKVNGVVMGFLTPDNKIDKLRFKQIINLLPGKQIVCHRAFQEVIDQIQGLKDLHELGVEIVLTSGREKIDESLDLLKTLTETKLVIIQAGGGVGFDNIQAIKQVVDDIHVGTAIRQTKSWDAPISIAKINQMKALLN
ncbi:copper homeostasis protein CutC [Williamsoniiplasma lucivorax]|uniref:Copper homeostasis protein cutC homolog n=1 Tax=Williamsoniiplasma lucivorax TaxID=209274 RepID=A0A2S5RDJ8_9MOLU|nr:copper homeostasis protein CutC [Williamsoniiplasma lucivorax]PPE05377.1 copper homeostasis protein [Williamsoniiplasma lucivorax]